MDQSHQTVESLMKSIAQQGLRIDPSPDYPVQLTYADSKFNAIYEPNFDSVIVAEGPTPEAALEELYNKVMAVVVDIHYPKDGRESTHGDAPPLQ